MASEDVKKKADEVAIEAWSQMYVEELKAIFTLEVHSIRAALLINGGAAVALLSFLASTINAGSNSFVAEFSISLIAYVAGVLCAAVAYWVVYLSQSNYSRHHYNNNLKYRKILGDIFNYISVLLIIGAFSFFSYGGWVTYQTLLLVSNVP